ncbi:substrate-binding domain-containing protein [Oculatella sp. LEGE 06141]|nr:substrate-binding domain-containing protein [Oculatella sp. LEGE 06141]MBE9178125.1 substrate-binding domain-containing protein [Oculatella sp. LEGE 06141]
MKAIAILTTIGMMLLGLSSCNSAPPSNSVDPTPANEQVEATSQATIKIAPSSSTSTVLKLLVEAYQAQNPAAKLEFIVPSQSEGSIVAVKNNLADLAGTSHQVTPEEANGQLQYHELAKDLLLVATHSSVTGVTNLTTAQLRAIYKGDITNWKELGGPDATIVVLDRPEDESAKRLLRQYYLDQDPTTSDAILLSKETELIQTLQDTSYAIGAFSLAYSVINQLPVNRLSLNGVAPTLANFNQGDYLMVRQMGIVWNKTPSDATQAFIDFIFSPEGSQVLQKNGFVPIS